MDRRRLEQVIRDAAADNGGRPGQLDIVYAKKTTGNVVVRRVRPYEIRSGTFWATDRIHGATRIHNFLTRRIMDAAPAEPPGSYRPQWAILVPGADPERREPKP